MPISIDELLLRLRAGERFDPQLLHAWLAASELHPEYLLQLLCCNGGLGIYPGMPCPCGKALVRTRSGKPVAGYWVRLLDCPKCGADHGKFIQKI